jgi:CBS domain-containing protein
MRAAPVPVVDEAASVEKVEKRFDEDPKDHMVVTTEGKLVGQVPRKSFQIAGEQGINLAKPSLYAVEMDDNLRDVLSKMLLHDRKELPVVDDNGILKGTINYDDVHRCMMKIYFQNSKSE